MAAALREERLERAGVRRLEAREGRRVLDAVMQWDGAQAVAVAIRAPKTGGVGVAEPSLPMGSKLRWKVENLLGIAVDERQPLSEAGLDSLMAIELRNWLIEETGLKLAATLLFDYPTLEKLSAYLSEQVQRPGETVRPAVRKEIAREPVAIVGMACRFPGGADTVERFWELLRHGVDAIQEVPRDRWAMEAHPEPGVRYGGFIERISDFDPQFFGISPREAASMDPQQRLLLEVTWHALEDAGISADSLRDTPAGVFVGAGANEYAKLAGGDAVRNGYFATGNANSVLAGRISYAYGWTGPSLVVDTACSSSLVSVHLAVQSLQLGECHLAVAAGVNALLSPDTSIALSSGRMLAPDGRCKAFDAAADGYVRGEGCGVVVLKRLSDAQRDHDRIVAVILATATNQDGRTASLTAPSGHSQRVVIRQALASSGLDPSAIGYFEAHGTGTSLGDQIEVVAIRSVYAQGKRDAPLTIGSVKSNFGHLEAAAGIAGLMKAVLAIDRQGVPPTLHLREWNPMLPPEDEWLRAARGFQPLAPGTRNAAVSSFGFSGTNAHAVLGEPQGPPPDLAHGVEILPISAASAASLRELALRWVDWLRRVPEPWTALCFSAQTGRSHRLHRLAVVARTKQEAADLLDAWLRGRSADGIWHHVVEQRQGSFEGTADPATLAERYVAGWEIGWHPAVNGRRAACPLYPFDRQPYWHPRTGAEFTSRTLFDPAHLPFLDEHVVYGERVCPGAALLEMARAAGESLPGSGPVTIVEAVFEQPIVLNGAKSPEVELVLSKDAAFRISIGAVLHCAGRLRRGAVDSGIVPMEPFGESARVDDFYDRFEKRGIRLGRSFRCIRRLWRDHGRARAILAYEESPAHVFPPGLLDSCLQVLAAAGPDSADALSSVPAAVEDVTFFRPPAPRMQCAASLIQQSGRTATGSILLSTEDGQPVLQIGALHLRAVVAGELIRSRNAAGWLYEMHWVEADPVAARPLPGRWLLLGENPVLRTYAAAAIHAGGGAIAPGGSTGGLAGVVVLASDDPVRGFAVLTSLARDPVAAPVWFVASGAVNARGIGQAVFADPNQAGQWAAAGSLATENPDLRLTRVDLDPKAPAESLAQELTRPSGGQIAWRDGQRLRPVLQQHPAGGELPCPAAGLLRLGLRNKGSLENLYWEEIPAAELHDDAIEIEVLATGLNFRDVLQIRGLYPGDAGPLGYECAGRVIAAGAHVSAFQAGDLVMGLGSGCFGSRVTIPANCAAHIPPGIDVATAATLPVAFVTAILSLREIARVKPGEHVLIHSAAGGVGLAAVQVARSLGAEIYATAGSAAKQAYLRSLGIRHIFSSRNTEFARAIAEIANGRGVDVVLNSLTGDILTQSMAVLAPGGRFIELGKREVAPTGTAFALDREMSLNPERIGKVLGEVAERIGRGDLVPLPRRVFFHDRTVEALRFLESARHTGKVVVSRTPGFQPSPHAVYWITGGTGALGRRVAEWLVARGARRIALTSRSANPPAWLDPLRQAGATIELLPGDIGSSGTAQRLLGEIEIRMGPLAGVFHCAGIVDDGAMASLDNGRFEAVFAGKASGAWALHIATEGRALECFVLFSSAAGLLGAPGQGNYAAANAYLDALAEYRRQLRLPALSIQWGPWSETGMAARLTARQRERLQESGVYPIAPEEGLAVLDLLLQEGEPGVSAIAAMHAGPGVLARYGSATAHTPAGAAASELAALMSDAPQNRDAILRTFLRDAAAKLLGLPAASLSMHRPLAEMGMDSLAAVEFRSRLAGAVGTGLPATLLFNYPALEPLARYLETRFFAAVPVAASLPQDALSAEEDLLRELDNAGY